MLDLRGSNRCAASAFLRSWTNRLACPLRQFAVTCTKGQFQGSTRKPLRIYFSPSSLPVELWMKCILLQAEHATAEYRSFASSGTSSASQCCTFIPVLGHLNRMG